MRWSDGEARGRGAVVLEAATEALMEQLVDFPTHTRGNILDIIITNVPERIFDVEDVGRLEERPLHGEHQGEHREQGAG